MFPAQRNAISNPPSSGLVTRRPGSKQRVKVSFFRGEASREPSLHDQAHSAAESLVSKSRECVLQYQQQHSWYGVQHGGGSSASSHHVSVSVSSSSAAGANASTATGSSSSSKRRWPWPIWGCGSSRPSSSGATDGAAGSSHGTTASYSRSDSSPAASLLEEFAAAISEEHARRELMQQQQQQALDAAAAAPAGNTNAAAVTAAAGAGAAGAVAGTAVISSSSYLQSFGSSSSGSSWEEAAVALRAVEDSWDADDSSSSSRGESSQLFLYDLMSPAAAEAAAAAGKAASGASSNSKLSLLLGDTYHGSIPATDATLSAGGSPLASADEVFGTQQQRHKRQQRNKQQQQRGQQGWGAPFEGADSPVVPLPDAAALQRSLRSMAPFGRPSPTSSSTSSSSRQVGRTSSSSSASSASEDSDWLTAVLSAPTSRLSSHSNTVLTNSLRRLASLRQAAGIGLGGAAAAAAAAADADEGLRGLLDSIRSRFGTFQLQQFEEVALQLAQLGYQPNAEWLAAFERSSLAVMPGGSPRLLSRLLLSRSKLGGPVSSEWCVACCQQMAAAPHKLSVSSWVNALYALVRLKHMPNRQFQLTFFSATVERLDDVSPDLLTHLVWSLSRLKLSPSALWWRGLISATASIEKPFSHAQLASLVHSVALWAGPGGIAAPDVQRFVDMLLVEIHEHLGVLQPAELTTVIWALGSLVSARKLRPDHALQEELLAAVQDQLPRLSPMQCSNLCWGLAKLSIRLPGSFSEALLLEVQAQLSGFSNSSLCSVLWAVARLGLVPPAPFRQLLWEELQHRIKRLGLQDLSTLLWSLAQLQLQPPEDVLQELCEASTPLVPACDATHLTNIVWALGRLQARPCWELVEAVEAASLQVLPTAGLTQVVNLTWGLCRLAAHNPASSSAAAASAHTSDPDSTPGHTSDHSVAGPRASHGAGHPSAAWQAVCLRELRMRCVCAGVDVDCKELLQMLRELGAPGLAEGAAAAADKLFAEQEDEAVCYLQVPAV